MLAYTSTAPAARILLQGAHTTVRCSGRRFGNSIRLPSSGSSPFYSLSVCTAATRTRPQTQEQQPGQKNSPISASARVPRPRLAAAANSFRYLSSTTCRRLAGENQDGGSSSTEKKKQQQQAKGGGIRKVLPSLTLTPHENIYTVPNLLTFSRLAAAPFVGWAILHDAHTLALGLFAYAGVSDLLDGWIARRWKLQTVVGSVVDPMADKMLMTVLTVCLAMKGALPVWLAIIILGRDVGLGIAAIYYRWISLPPPKTFTRYWDFSLPSAEVRPTTISKYNTFLQLGLMGATMVTPVITTDVSSIMTAFQYLVATTTIWSGLSYVFSKDAVRILSENKEQKSKDS
ncbi:CDP-alcohol phosphatidyltransferase-domain-containing protein [Nemania sp. FL0031]|nr:CDP-alcohol phosphatidyltransferase-domain-containing protein [Nemania sp. FL0031]